MSIREINPRLKNREVAITASSQNRIIVTADKNFPRVVFKEGIKVPGILLLVDIEFLKAAEIAETIIMAISSGAIKYGYLVVYSPYGVKKIRKLPGYI